MYNVIIVDDELSSIETLEWEIQQNCPDLNVVAKCQSPQDGIEKIREHKPDLVFLDIEMPKLNGFQMLKEIPKIDFDVIFITAYDQFALEAIKANAMDYLLKPIDPEELVRAIEKVKSNRRPVVSQEMLEKLFTNLKHTHPHFPAIALPSMEGLEFIHVDEIIRCESESNYTKIFTTNGAKIVVSKTLKEMEEAVKNHHFYRVHNSHLVNLIHIKKYKKGKGGILEMSNGESIPVSRSRRDELLKKF